MKASAKNSNVCWQHKLRASAMPLSTTVQVTKILNEHVFAVRWHASLRKFFEWSSFRFGTMPGTGGDSLSEMGKLQYTGVCYRLAGLIFS